MYLVDSGRIYGLFLFFDCRHLIIIKYYFEGLIKWKALYFILFSMERVEGKDNPQRSNSAVNTSHWDYVVLLLLYIIKLV